MFSRNVKTRAILASIFAAAMPLKAEVNWSGTIQLQPFLDSRQVTGMFDNMFNAGPAQQCLDANGDDMNAQVQFSLNTWSSHLGVEASSEAVRGWKPSGEIGFDFVGSMPAAGGMGQAQLGSAFFKLDDVMDDYHHITIGYDSHPIQPDECQPQVLGYGFGAPIAIFSSQPQIRYKFTGGSCDGKFGLMAAALSQGQLHASCGPVGCTTQYIRDAIVPNLYFQLDYERKHEGDEKALCGVGVDYKRLAPRTTNNCGAACLSCLKDMADTGGLKCCTGTAANGGGDCCQGMLPCDTGCNPCNTCFDGVCTPSEDGCGTEDGSNGCNTGCKQSGCLKLKEFVDSVSATFFAFKKWNSVTLRTQVIYAQNLAEMYGLTGYCVTNQAADGSREYAPTQSIAAWFDLSSSKEKIVPGIFAGFNKTLGSTKKICVFDDCGQPITYGWIMNMDYEVRVSPRCVFNIGDFAVGVEFEFSGAAMGTLDNQAKVQNAQFVANYRTLVNLEYSFA